MNRYLLIALSSIGLVAVVIDNVENGWGPLGVVAMSAFALAIVYQLAMFSHAKPHN